MDKKYFSTKQENMIANELGWHRVSGSGARLTHIGDIVSDEWVGECKTHTTPNHPITFVSTVWAKIRDEGRGISKYPALFVDDGSQMLSRTWVMFPLNTFDLSGCMLQPYCLPIQTNISFSYDTLTSETSDGVPIIYTYCYDKISVGVTKLGTFSQLLSGDI